MNGDQIAAPLGGRARACSTRSSETLPKEVAPLCISSVTIAALCLVLPCAGYVAYTIARQFIPSFKG